MQYDTIDFRRFNEFGKLHRGFGTCDFSFIQANSLVLCLEWQGNSYQSCDNFGRDLCTYKNVNICNLNQLMSNSKYGPMSFPFKALKG